MYFRVWAPRRRTVHVVVESASRRSCALFPDGSDEGLYHTADATLWFFHALHRYLEYTHDRAILPLLMPTLLEIYERHRGGTRFGIGMDAEDGLLRQGAEGYQLTWMDAKGGDWVVTPRRGKAVEVNALWYNALCLLESWLRESGGEARAAEVAEVASLVKRSFNRRFWYEGGGYLYDVVDGPHGDSAECRPIQIIAISLDHPVLERSRWEPVLRIVEERLLTPVGLRSLIPGSAEYKARYSGDLRSRDAAYHQGTVWGWLIGPWIDAWLRVHPNRRAEARRFLDRIQRCHPEGAKPLQDLLRPRRSFASLRTTAVNSVFSCLTSSVMTHHLQIAADGLLLA
jgi:predicted glycogen debranching enzyme